MYMLIPTTSFHSCIQKYLPKTSVCLRHFSVTISHFLDKFLIVPFFSFIDYLETGMIKIQKHNKANGVRIYM